MTTRPEPVDPPTLQLAAPEGTGTRVSWKNDVSADFELTLVVRYLMSPDGFPSGPVPAVGARFGSGEVLHASAAQSVLDPVAAQACKKVTYELFTHGRSGAYSAGVVAVARGTELPVDAPGAFAAVRFGAMVQLDWVATSARTQVRRDGAVIYDGTGTSTGDVLPASQGATYTAFACNDCGECSELGASLTLTAPDAGLPLDLDAGHELRPLGFTAHLDGGAVLLAWGLPDAGLTHVRVLRRRDAPVYGAADPLADVVFDGPGATATEPVSRTFASPLTNHYAAFGCDGTQCEQAGARAQLQVPLKVALNQGGYSVWFRHATASTCIDHSDLGTCTPRDGGWSCPAEWWKSCDPVCSTATARQLTPPQSDLEIAAIRAAFSDGGFAVSRVRSSEFCRVRTTAALFAFGPPVETTEQLTFFLYDEANRCTTAYALLNEPPDAGANGVLVSHAGFTCPVLDSLASAEAAVFKPDPPRAPVFITRLRYDQW